MPFQSEKQRAFMYANHPQIAARWEAEEKSGKYDRTLRRKKPRVGHSGSTQNFGGTGGGGGMKGGTGSMGAT